MAIEYRNGKPCYYRKKKRNGKVISEYAGSGELALIIAKLDRYERQSTKAKQELKRKEQTLHRQADDEVKHLEKTLNEIFTSIAIANGYHKPKRQWRKKRQK